MSYTDEQFPRTQSPAVPVDNLIFESREFRIWLDEKSLDVWWDTNESIFEEESNSLQSREEWGEIIAKQTELEALPMSHLSKDLQRGFRFLIGTAILLLFTQKFDQAKQTLQNAEGFYRARTAEKARAWILEAGLGSVLAATFVAEISGWAGMVVSSDSSSLFERIMLGGFLGIWGAFISLFLRASVLGVDATAGCYLHYLETTGRVISGFISGGIVVCAVTAGIIAPDLAKIGPAMIMILGFSAGFSERLLPTLVGNAETIAMSKKKVAVGRTSKKVTSPAAP